MSVRTALRLELANRPGQLANALRPIVQAGVNLHAVSGVASAQSSFIDLLPSDPASAADALQHAGFTVHEVEAVVTWLPNRPGTLLKACEALGAAGINIDGVYVISTDPAQGVQLTFECREAQRADQVLAGVSY